jgi:two-component system, NtrC family, response regulator HydG
LEGHHLPPSFSDSTPTRSTATQFSTSPDLDSLGEKEALIEALRLSNGNKVKASKILNVHRMTVWNRMKKYGIQLTRKIE